MIEVEFEDRIVCIEHNSLCKLQVSSSSGMNISQKLALCLCWFFGATRPHRKGVFCRSWGSNTERNYTSKMFISGSLERNCDQKAFSTVAGELFTVSERDRREWWFTGEKKCVIWVPGDNIITRYFHCFYCLRNVSFSDNDKNFVQKRKSLTKLQIL